MRKLIAALACRNGGQRLYGKPLQNLAPGTTILDQILATMENLSEIATPVLGVSEGVENRVFVEIAEARSVPYIVGDQRDVLSRLIECGREAAATDVFRITTECPFLHFEPLAEAWRRHVDDANDITVTDLLPEGTAFEIYTLDALERSHRNGSAEHRSEMCSWYAQQHPNEFKIAVVTPDEALRRTDLRLTVDYPEDLVICRDIYRALKDEAPLIPLADIIRFLDGRPDLRALMAPYVDQGAHWLKATQTAA